MAIRIKRSKEEFKFVNITGEVTEKIMKLQGLLEKIFWGICLLAFVPIIFAIYFNTPNADLLGTRKLVNIFMLLILAFACFYIKYLNILIQKIKNERKFIFILFIIYSIGLFLFSLFFMQEGYAETYWVYDAAHALAKQEDLRLIEGGYYTVIFSKYHYLKGILFVTAFFEKIAVLLHINEKIFLSFVNAAFIAISLPSTFYVSKKLFNRQTAYCAISMCLFFLPVYFSTCIFYNYIFIYSIPITILAIYVMVDEKEGLKQGILIGFLTGIGFCVFNTSIIVTIAILIDILLLRRFKLRNALYIAGFSMVFILVLNAYFSVKYEEKIYEEEIYEHYRYPVLESTAYVGFNEATLGLYSVEDRDYIDSFESYAGKKNGLSKAITARLEEMSIVEKIVFFINKSAINFGNGTYYSEFVTNDNLVKDRKVIQFFSKDYENVKFYRSFYGAFNLWMLLGVGVSMLNGFKERYITLVPWVSMFGVLLVTLISETNPRHILAYVPFIFIIASYMLSKVEEKIAKVKIAKCDSKFYIRKK